MSEEVEIVKRSACSDSFLIDCQKNRKSILKERIIKSLLFSAASFSIIVVFSQIFFLFREAAPFSNYVSLWDFLFGSEWYPTEQPPRFGALSLIVGTLLVTIGSMVFAVPLGIGSAIFISEIASPKIKNFLKSAVEILAGIPSVIYGFFGLILLTNWIRIGFDIPSGQTWFAGSILLGIMALPTIISVTEDGLTMVPNEYREASLALGANKMHTIFKVVVPSASSFIATAIILGMGRAIGETMAVIMVTGNTALIPSPLSNIFSPIRTITATLGIETPEVAFGGDHYTILFLLGVILFGIVILLNLIAGRVMQRIQLKFVPKVSEKSLHSPKKALSPQKKRFLVNLKNGGGIVLLYAFLSFMSNFLTGLLLLLSLGSIFFLFKRFSSKMQQKIVFTVLYLLISFTILILVILLGYIIINGIPAISLEFLLSSPRRLGREGGILPAIIGTLYLTFGAILFAVPIGLGAGIYLSEYAIDNRFTRFIRLTIDNLNGTPSIVFGLFGFVVFVLMTQWGKTLLAGQLTLSLMILPTIIRTTEESIKSVSPSLREASYAVGATKWTTIRMVVLPSASPGIITGIILGMGRAAGETAPIMFTAAVFYSRFLPQSPFDPVMALPYHLYLIATTVPGGTQNAFGTALVLLVIIVLLYSIAMHFRNRMKSKIKLNFFY